MVGLNRMFNGGTEFWVLTHGHLIGEFAGWNLCSELGLSPQAPPKSVVSV